MFAFLSSVCRGSQMNHHPKWDNVYGHLRVQLETHDVSGISDFDIYMAQQIDLYAASVRKL